MAAGIARVVSAMVDPNPEVAGAGHWRMAEAGVVVEFGVGAEEAVQAHAGHIRRVRDGRPHVLLKLAQPVHLAGKVIALAHELLRGGRVIPQRRILGAGVQFGEAAFRDIPVKDASSAAPPTA